MNRKTLLKLTILTAAIGLALIFSVILSGAAYPDLFFKIAIPLGLILVFISVILGFISWLCTIKSAAKDKQYIWAGIVAVLGLIVIITEVMRIL